MTTGPEDATSASAAPSRSARAEARRPGIGGRKRRRRRLAWRRGRLRNTIEYVGLRLIGFALRLLPVPAASAFMGWCWRVIAPRLHRHPRALAHLAVAFPELSDEARERIALDMWENLGRVFGESFMIDRIMANGLVDYRTGPIADAIKARQQGVVFVSLHAGNFELAVTPSQVAGIAAAGIYQKVKNPLIDRYLVDLRRERFPRGLFEKGAQIARRVMRIVRDGGAVGIMADLRDRRGVSVPFFGRPAPSTPFPALICRTCDAALVAVRVIRLPKARFVIEAEPIEVPRTADREADVEEATRRVQALFEVWIREHPAQWMWAHRRWG